MTFPNSDPSRLGQDQLAGDVRALFLDLFGGEVITAFETATILKDKHMVRALQNGRAYKFPAIWRANGGYHQPGEIITGDQIEHTEITVDPDDKLVSSVFVADIDELLNHFDVRQPYTKELGEFLARHYDANVLRTILTSARGPALFSGDQGGSGLQNSDFVSDAVALIDGFSSAKQTMDEKDVPVNSMPVHGLLRPAQWYLVARSDRNLNRDFNSGDASIRSMTLTTIDDIMVHKSNIASEVFGQNDSANSAIPEPYRANFTPTVGAVWTPMAAASVIVQDVGFNIVDQPEKQGTLMISRMMAGTRSLRTKCAVELRTGPVPT